MIVISNEEFLWRTGINLEAKLEGQDVSVEDMSKIHRTRWSEYVYDVVKSSSTRPVIEDAKLTDLQIETIKSCEADMGIFIFQYGDPKANGYYEGEVNMQYQNLVNDIKGRLQRVGLIRKSWGRRW